LPSSLDESLLSADCCGWEFEDGYGAEPTLLANVRLLWTGERAADLSRPLDGLSVVVPRVAGKAR
jgi:hypothetical protein